MSQAKLYEQVSINLESLLKRLFRRQEANYYAIFGRRGSGKTDFSLLVTEFLHYQGIIKHQATNIKVLNSNFPIEPISDLFTLKKWLKKNRGRKLYIFDEIGRTVPRRTPMARLNVKIINELQILRKYKLSMLIITVHERFTDNAILGTDLLDGVFRKPNFRNPKNATYEDNLERINGPLEHLPRTEIGFDSYDSALFTLLPTKTPMFEEPMLNNLYKWSKGATYHDLGIHREIMRRNIKKFVKETLEKQFHMTHS